MPYLPAFGRLSDLTLDFENEPRILNKRELFATAVVSFFISGSQNENL